MPNLLQKASIVLTPTAYNDGEVLCAKPDDGGGDFDFSRNSAATRVNAQGLVENVQILSSNLVQNGDFSEEGAEEVSNGSFSQEGVEEITNGDFSSDTSWVKASGTTISDGKLNITANSTNDRTFQNVGMVQGKIYKLVLEVSNYQSGSLFILFGGSGTPNIPNITSNGTYTFYQECIGTNGYFYFGGNLFDGSIDNVSVREVGQDWTLGTGWSIAEDKAICDGTSSILRQPNVIPLSTIVKVSFNINDYVSGNVTVKFAPNQYPVLLNGNGTYTIYTDGNNTANGDLQLISNSFNGSITNISVKEVGMDWVFSGGAEITAQGARINNTITGANAFVKQVNSNLTIGKSLVFQYDVVQTNGKNLAIEQIGGNISLNTSTIGNNRKVYFEFDRADASLIIKRAEASTDVTITNISVIEITDDTNLPRINYEGFSYQDALGSELVTNGDFSNGSTDWAIYNNTGTSTNISNGVLNIVTDGTITSAQQSNVFTIGKEYKVTFDVISTNGNNLANSTNSIIYDTSTIGSKVFYVVPDSATFVLKRAGGATDVTIDNVSVKEYLGQEVVPDSGCGSWLFEPQSTNRCNNSEQPSVWHSNRDVTITANAVISPQGILNASTVVNTATTNSYVRNLFNYSSSAATLNVTTSFFIKYTNNQWVFLRPQFFSGGSEERTWFDIQNGVLGTNDNVSSSIKDFGNGWYRCSVTHQIAPATDTTGYVGIFACDSDNSQAQTIGQGFAAFGSQGEELTYATSYIPTDGTSVTRNQDVCNNGGSLSTINSTEGVLYAEIAALANDGTTRFVGLNDGSNTNRVVILYYSSTNRIRAIVSSGGTKYVDLNYQLTNILDFHKVAIKYKLNDFALWIDGVEVATDTSLNAPIGLNTLDFLLSGSNNFFGKTKALAVWKEALSDEELADLTYPTPTDPTFTLDFDTIAEQFTFARGSEATYVDAQGLIQSTNEIGPELITNGDFSNGSTDWVLNDWTVANGKASLLNGSSFINQNNILEAGKTYKIQYTISDYVSGTIRWRSAGVNGSVNSSNGVVTDYITVASTGFGIQGYNGFTGSIDNISAKEYTTATNTPRLDYSTGAEAFLLEPQSTNLIPYSEDFSQWDVINTPIITSNYGVSPDGTQNADRLQMNTNDRIYTSVPASGNTAFSVYLKGSGIITLRDSTNVYRQDVTLTSEWERYSLYFNATSNNVQIQNQKVGDVDCEIWGAQVEALSYPTSYIPTSGTTVTRNQETCINATPEINSEEGVLYFEGSALVNGDTSRIIGLSDGTNDNLIYIRFDLTASRFYGFARGGGGSYTSVLKNGINQTDYNKVALVWNATNLKIWINGSEQDTATINNLPIAINTLDFTSPTGSNNFFGNTKDLQVYTKALSDAELIKLTT